jgi:hypothetical protein
MPPLGSDSLARSENGGVKNSSRRDSKRRVVATWIALAAVFGVAVGVWGTTLGGIVAVRAPVAVATPEPDFGVRHTFIATLPDGVPATAAATCIYGQSNQGMLVVISAQTGSLLSEAQAANCTK